jgi:hypothetical protein
MEVFELMFAAALSGMRAGGAAERTQPEPIEFDLTPSARLRVADENDWRTGRQYFLFKEEQDCPVFFEKELPGFGTLRVTSLCAARSED